MSTNFYLICFLLAILYFFPTILAYRRKKRNKDSVLLLNLLLGWTFIGWVVALIWGSTEDPKPVEIKGGTTTADAIAKLAELQEKGLITAAEFETEKKKILAK